MWTYVQLCIRTAWCLVRGSRVTWFYKELTYVPLVLSNGVWRLRVYVLTIILYPILESQLQLDHKVKKKRKKEKAKHVEIMAEYYVELFKRRYIVLKIKTILRK